MDSRVIRTHDLAVPIFAAQVVANEAFQVHQIVGTAFAITEDVLMTAWHVIASLDEGSGVGVVGFVTPENSNKGAPIIEWERIGPDVGLLKVEHFHNTGTRSLAFPMYWRDRALEQFDPVRSIGYPFGIYEIDGIASTLLRGFQGHVVANIPTFRPAGMKGDPFPIYEVSFLAPRGLSGAPILQGVGSAAVCGMVIGNSASKMLVFESEEVEEGSGSRSVYQHYESLSHGVAIQGDFLLGLQSELLGGTVGEVIQRQRRLVSP